MFNSERFDECLLPGDASQLVSTVNDSIMFLL